MRALDNRVGLEHPASFGVVEAAVHVNEADFNELFVPGKASLFGNFSGVDLGLGPAPPGVESVSLGKVALFVGNGSDGAQVILDPVAGAAAGGGVLRLLPVGAGVDADHAFGAVQVVPLFDSAVLAVLDFEVAEVPGDGSAVIGNDGFADAAIGSVVAVGKSCAAFLD